MTGIAQRLVNRLVTVLVVLLVGLGGMAGYRMTKSQMAAQVYRQRLQKLSENYETLRTTYNEAVRRTAVTELVIKADQLSVHVRTADGEARKIETPFDPDQAVYVDYVVKDGRLWIRRVFDEYTPPGKGVLIDPKLGAIDWDAQSVEHGKAVYRRLSEGRWVVTVTGDGSLGLEKRDADAPAELSPPPKVRDYEQMQQQLQKQIDEVSATDVMHYWLGG